MDTTGIDSVLVLLGNLIRPFGALVFGIAMGWFGAKKLSAEEKSWQLQIAVYLGLLGAMVTMPMFAGAGAVAAFTIGVALGVLIPAIIAAVQKGRAK